MRKLLTALSMALVLTVLMSTCEAADVKQPLRLARLPIIILSGEPDTDAMAGLELKVSRAIHLPLNGTLKAIEYISATEASQEMQDVWRKLYKKNHKARLQEAMAPLAKKLRADMVVCPVLRRYSQDLTIGSGLTEGSENYLRSHAEVELIIYERATDEITFKRESRSYAGEESSWGTARFLAEDCMLKVIADTDLREKVLSRTPLRDRALIDPTSLETETIERTPVERTSIERTVLEQ